MVRSKSDIALNCGFYLKNMTDTETISWKIETSGGTELPLQSPLLISAGTTDPYLGIKWPQDQDQLKLTATAGSRTLVLKLLKPAYTLSNLTAVDYNATARKATAGQTLYLVKAPLKAEKATIQWTSNIASPLFTQYFTVDGSTSPNPLTSNKILYTYSETPSSTTYRINAMDYDKTVKVEVVDEERIKLDIAKKLSPLLEVFNSINYWSNEFKKFGIPCSISILDNFNVLFKRSQLSFSYQTYNEEKDKSRLYNDVKEFELTANGAEIAKVDCGKELSIPIPFTNYDLDIASLNIGVVAGLECGLNIKREKTIETNTVSYSGSQGYGGIYATPNISASVLGVKGIAELKFGGKIVYPYEGNKNQAALIPYMDDFVGKVTISKDASLFVTKDFSYEVFRIKIPESLKPAGWSFNISNY